MQKVKDVVTLGLACAVVFVILGALWVVGVREFPEVE